MKNTLKTLVLGLALTSSFAFAQTSAPAAAADVNFYATPSVVAAFPGDFDTTAGAALAFGATIKQAHSVEAQIIWFESKARGWFKVAFIPVVATYKYRVPLSGKFSLNVGASAGATFLRPAASWYGDATAFTYGLVGGASYQLTESVSVDADLMTLRLQDTNFTTDGTIALLTVGCRFRF